MRKLNNIEPEDRRCCYCETWLDEKNYSKEHVVPRHAGGKIIKPCCKSCNREKGGLLLNEYLSKLSVRLSNMEATNIWYRHIQTKIINVLKMMDCIE
jgi:hypothetical protein